VKSLRRFLLQILPVVTVDSRCSQGGIVKGQDYLGCSVFVILLIMWFILGAFAKLQEATVSFIMSFFLSVCME
jgi:hypothetical protein